MQADDATTEACIGTLMSKHVLTICRCGHCVYTVWQ